MHTPRPFLSALFLVFFAPYLVLGPLPAYALRDLSVAESPPKQAGLEEHLLGPLPDETALIDDLHSFQQKVKEGAVVHVEALKTSLGNHPYDAGHLRQLVELMRGFNRDIYVMPRESLGGRECWLGDSALWLSDEAINSPDVLFRLIAAFESKNFDRIHPIPQAPPDLQHPVPPPSPPEEIPDIEKIIGEGWMVRAGGGKAAPVQEEPAPVPALPDAAPPPQPPPAPLSKRDVQEAYRISRSGELGSRRIMLEHEKSDGAVLRAAVDHSGTFSSVDFFLLRGEHPLAPLAPHSMDPDFSLRRYQAKFERAAVEKRLKERSPAVSRLQDLLKNAKPENRNRILAETREILATREGGRDASARLQRRMERDPSEAAGYAAAIQAVREAVQGERDVADVEKARWRLSDRLPGRALGPVYYDAFRAALLARIEELQASGEPPLADAVWIGQRVLRLETEWAYTTLIAEKAGEARFSDERISIFPTAGIGFLYLDSRMQPREFFSGGDAAVPPRSMAVRYSPGGARDRLRDDRMVVPLYFSLTGSPNLQLLNNFLEDSARLHSELPGHPEIGMGLFSAEEGLRIYRFSGGMEDAASRDQVVEALRRELPAFRAFWRFTDKKIYLDVPTTLSERSDLKRITKITKKSILRAVEAGLSAQSEGPSWKWARTLARTFPAEFRGWLKENYGEPAVAELMAAVMGRLGGEIRNFHAAPDRNPKRLSELIPAVTHLSVLVVSERRAASLLENSRIFTPVSIPGWTEPPPDSSVAAASDGETVPAGRIIEDFVERSGKPPHNLDPGRAREFAQRTVPLLLAKGQPARFIDLKKLWEEEPARLAKEAREQEAARLAERERRRIDAEEKQARERKEAEELAETALLELQTGSSTPAESIQFLDGLLQRLSGYSDLVRMLRVEQARLKVALSADQQVHDRQASQKLLEQSQLPAEISGVLLGDRFRAIRASEGGIEKFLKAVVQTPGGKPDSTPKILAHAKKMQGKSSGEEGIFFSAVVRVAELLQSGLEEKEPKPYKVFRPSGEEGHGIESILFDPEGNLLSASLSTSVRSWDVKTGRSELVLKAPFSFGINLMAMDPKGRFIAVADSTGDTVWLWDEENGQGKQLVDPIDHTVITSLAFSPTGDLLASGGERGEIWVWDVKTGEPVSMLSGHTDWVTGLAFSPDGELLFSSGVDGTVRLWDAREGSSLQVLPAEGWRNETRKVWSLGLSPDGKTLAAAGDGHTIRLFEVTGDLAPRLAAGAVLESRLDQIRHLVFSPDGKRLAASGSQLDTVVEIWDSLSGRLLNEVPTGKWARSVAFSSRGKVLAVAVNSRDRKAIQLWKVADLVNASAPEKAPPAWTPEALASYVKRYKLQITLEEARKALSWVERQAPDASPVAMVVAWRKHGLLPAIAVKAAQIAAAEQVEVQAVVAARALLFDRRLVSANAQAWKILPPLLALYRMKKTEGISVPLLVGALEKVGSVALLDKIFREVIYGEPVRPHEGTSVYVHRRRWNKVLEQVNRGRLGDQPLSVENVRQMLGFGSPPKTTGLEEGRTLREIAQYAMVFPLHLHYPDLSAVVELYRMVGLVGESSGWAHFERIQFLSALRGVRVPELGRIADDLSSYKDMELDLEFLRERIGFDAVMSPGEYGVFQEKLRALMRAVRQGEGVASAAAAVLDFRVETSHWRPRREGWLEVRSTDPESTMAAASVLKLSFEDQFLMRTPVENRPAGFRLGKLTFEIVENVGLRLGDPTGSVLFQSGSHLYDWYETTGSIFLWINPSGTELKVKTALGEYKLSIDPDSRDRAFSLTSPASGLEEVAAARDRVQERLAAWARSSPEFGKRVAVIGPSIYRQGTMRFLPALVEKALGPVQRQIFFDPENKGQRTIQWTEKFYYDGGDLPAGAVYFGSQDEFESFEHFAGTVPIPRLPVDRPKIMASDPVGLLLQLLKSLGLSVEELGLDQRQQLERDLGLLIQA